MDTQRRLMEETQRRLLEDAMRENRRIIDEQQKLHAAELQRQAMELAAVKAALAEKERRLAEQVKTMNIFIVSSTHVNQYILYDVQIGPSSPAFATARPLPW